MGFLPLSSLFPLDSCSLPPSSGPDLAFFFAIKFASIPLPRLPPPPRPRSSDSQTYFRGRNYRARNATAFTSACVGVGRKFSSPLERTLALLKINSARVSRSDKSVGIAISFAGYEEVSLSRARARSFHIHPAISPRLRAPTPRDIRFDPFNCHVQISPFFTNHLLRYVSRRRNAIFARGPDFSRANTRGSRFDWRFISWSGRSVLDRGTLSALRLFLSIDRNAKANIGDRQ